MIDFPIRHCVGSVFTADALFPATDDDGRNPIATPEAVKLARQLLDVPPSEPDSVIVWNLPDVFSIPYGSNDIGTASYVDRVVEFCFDE